MVVMATMMVPGEATIISNYLTVSSWGMLDTYQVLIVPYLTSAMGIFLFRQFYMTFPISLYESAKLDGCSKRTGMICPMVMHPAMIKEFNMNRRSGTVRNALIKLEKVGFLGKRFNSVVNSSLEGISAILMA